MILSKFTEFLSKSGLVDEDGIEQSMQSYRAAHDDQSPSDGHSFGEFLVDQGTITRWHCDKIYAGKYRGFFLGKYKLLGHIGTGGMSSVYLAEHTLMRQQRAIKVLPRKRQDDKAYLDRFYLEARATAALHHPNIVQAYDVDSDGSTHYLVMEFVDGRDISLIVKDRGPLPLDLAANYTAQAAVGLQYAHDEGLIHRDVKPGNLLVANDGTIKILDMGLALFTQDEESLTIANNEKVLGTADYLAPEQAINSHNIDHRADIYSLGCAFYFMLTGHAPFPEGSIAQRIACHQTRMPDPIREMRPECPRELIEICIKMIQKQASDRYQSTTEVAEVLDSWLGRNGYAKHNESHRLRHFISGSSTSGGDSSDDPASSSARLLAGISDSSSRKSQRKGTTSTKSRSNSNIRAESNRTGSDAKKSGSVPAKTDPVKKATAETVPDVTELGTDAPVIDTTNRRQEEKSTNPPAQSDSQVKKGRARGSRKGQSKSERQPESPRSTRAAPQQKTRSRKSSAGTGGSGKIPASSSDSGKNSTQAGSDVQKGSKVNNPAKRWLPEEIELDGLAELEAGAGSGGSAPSRNTSNQDQAALATLAPTGPTPFGAQRLPNRTSTSLLGLPTWVVWAAIGTIVFVICVLIAVVITSMFGSDSNSNDSGSMRESTAFVRPTSGIQQLFDDR